MNIRLRSAQRQNGDVAQPKWEEHDAEDKLAERLATQDDVPTLPPMTPVKPQIQRSEPASEPPRQPQRTVDAREIIETIVMAYMATDEDRVSIEVVGSDILVEQIVKTDGHMVKHRWAIGISRYVTSSRKLIK